MSKATLSYVCNECGGHTLKWQGQCPACGAWNTLETAAPRPAKRSGYAGEIKGLKLAEVQQPETERIPTGITELDRVLGGGLVSGSVVLIGGDPGIGKSTLLLQAAGRLPAGCPVLYVTGEESLQQIAMRAHRLEVDTDNLAVLAETCVEHLVQAASESPASCIVIDSIQTMYSEDIASAPGSVTQLRESAAQLVRLAKTTGTTVLLVGHVTKEGVIAGPRVLEHMVDAVLYFESESDSRFRILRAVKNRFGAANELGIFAMTEAGMREVRNPSAIFLSQHPEPVAGCVVTVSREGSRPLLIEVQALADQSGGAMPRRLALGMDQNRLSMLLATLNRHANVSAYDHDIFVNVVGGVRISETSADLAALVATVSSLRDRPVPEGTVVFGEVGLAGEIRPVAYGEERLREAVKRGFTHAVVPRSNLPKKPVKGIQLTGVDYLRGALEALGF
ncbi:MAG: DNA repair protein RadA [Gammaproteobacteria bacterium]|jgi:DNA repair protein RadA/Sms|nr:DNA repair protein RadA [Gammaproteobacteria bacterium]MDP6616058.1 DNA repair protein RadA [Gammaproteobacteria bacterium]MDP6695467.1 DNA repair protein RadA [Gammaproteobacteria bacterium]